MKWNTKKVLKYTLTPQFMPRIQDLCFSGFSYLAFFMAQAYRSVRLLPDGHPYLSAANMGRYGIRHVIAEAGNFLEFKKENLDQVVIYLLMLLGLILLATQLVLLFMSGFVEVAYAAAPYYGSSNPLDFFAYFRHGHPAAPTAGLSVEHDVAFVLLDRVFGIPGVTGAQNTSFFAGFPGTDYTCVVIGTSCFDLGLSTRVPTTPDRIIYSDYFRGAQAPVLNFPWPYHEALRGMVQVYSVGLLAIGVFIFLYFIFALAAETAQTGTPFGRRFNKIWSPVRIVMAMGLLIPIAHGLNPAQWILMYAAKWGSSFANNGWVIYNDALAGEATLLGPVDTVVATPSAPPSNTLMEFGSMLATCKVAYERMYGPNRPGNPPPVLIDAYLVNAEDLALQPQRLQDTPNLLDAINYFGNGTINVRFGTIRDQTPGGGFQTFDGGVVPLCGEITLHTTYVQDGVNTEPGSWRMMESYYRLIQILWSDASGTGAGITSINGQAQITFLDIGTAMTTRHVSIDNDVNFPLPTKEEITSLRLAYDEFIEDEIALAVQDQRTSTEWQERMEELGWAGAAVWYNKVAQLNGGLVSAVHAMPTIKKYAHILEETRKRKSSSNAAVSGLGRHQQNRGTDDQIQMDDDEEEEIAKAMFHAQSIWTESYSENPVSSSVLLDAVNAVFGTQGLFDMMRPENQDVHPLALLAALGRSIVDSSFRNLGYSVAASAGGGLANLFQQYQIGSFAGAAGSFFFQVAMIGLSIGFVLFYIIPFLPFIYFFFAVGGWVKGIFEAMVGVPLWALAHIRIDGNGLAPEAAMGGYYLILEIFLRPIFIIFGFVASMTIFAAQVRILNEIWSLVVSSLAGFSVDQSGGAGAQQTGSIEYLRGGVDEFFFTVMYAILCYMLAMASFKLVDQIPNHILRWMGASISTFGDQSGDPAEGLVRNSFIGARMVSDPMKSAAGGAKGAASAGGQAIKEITTRGT